MIKKIKIFYLAFIKKPSKINDAQLEAKLRTRVHAVEKSGNDEENTDALSIILGRKYFFEAKKRELLSQEEIEWCQLVLFAKHPTKGVSIESKDYEGKLFDTIKERRSIRSWEGGELSREDFETLLTAAKWAPSSCHRQPWHFLLINDKEKIELIAELRGQKFVKNAPSCILALINLEAYKGEEIKYTPYLDAGAAIQNLLLAAESLGYGACWVNFGNMEVEEEKRKAAKSTFGIPKEFEIVSIIPIGKNPGAKPHAPGRKSTKDIMHIGNF